jgi:DNA-binding response OmpR family regulator
VASQPNKPRLLLVDDDRDINFIFSRGLALAGFEVDSFRDSTDALDHYKTGYYAGIILDIRMPKMSGFELARQIWKQDANAEICFLTAYEIHEDEVKSSYPSLKSYCFLTKPMSIRDLVLHLGEHGIIATK